MSLSPAVAADVESIGQIPSVELALQVLIRATGLRIALIARVTPDSWTACAVRDGAGLGLKAGDQLELQTTY